MSAITMTQRSRGLGSGPWQPWRLWLRQVGLPGLVGGGLLLACAWFIALELPKRREAVAQAESDVRRLRHGLIARASSDSEGRSAPLLDEPPQAWARLWSSLPDDSQRLALQARVLASAAQAGVPLQAVQWQGEAVRWIAPEGTMDASAAGLWRQRMSMPVQVPYPALRTWLDQLQREPALTVDALDIQRGDLQSDQVQAQVSLSLWWRRSAQPATPQLKPSSTPTSTPTSTTTPSARPSSREAP